MEGPQIHANRRYAKVKRLLLTSLMLSLFSCLYAQEQPDSTLQPPVDTTDRMLPDTSDLAITPDSIETSKKGIFHYFKHDYPNPSKALVLSFAVPGAGQLYNKRWWKVPFVYGAIIGMGYLIDQNSTDYIRLKRAYRRKQRGLPHDFTGTGLDSSSRLKTRRDAADKNRQLSYVGFVAVYGLQAVEAFVDSHLSTFDVSEDLSWQFQPSLETTPYGDGVIGVGISLQFQ